MKHTWFIFLLLLPGVSADLILTEIMYHPGPEQGGNFNEWVEVYNGGNATVDLSEWQLNGGLLPAFNLTPSTAVVLAEKLTGTNSFEAFYGNNDTLWDAQDPNMSVLDIATLSLPDGSGLVNFSSPSQEFLFYYNTSQGGDGDGYSLEKQDLYAGDSFENWNLSTQLGGTPGVLFVPPLPEETAAIALNATIDNAPPELLFVSMPDEDNQTGFQIFPALGQEKVLEVLAEVSDPNGLADIQSVSLEMNNQSYPLSFLSSSNPTLARYGANLTLLPSLPAGIYPLTFIVVDAFGATAAESLVMEYLAMLAATVSSPTLDFAHLLPGSTSSEQTVGLTNTGNVAILPLALASDLTSGEQTISNSNLQIFSSDWLGLDVARTLEILLPAQSQLLALRLTIPQGYLSDTYQGQLMVVLRAG